MNIPEPPTPDINGHLDFVVMAPPNDNTDGRDCICGHAESDHHPLAGADPNEAGWKCRYCGCTRAYPAAKVPTAG